jgi:hypothetical protein
MITFGYALLFLILNEQSIIQPIVPDMAPGSLNLVSLPRPKNFRLKFCGITLCSSFFSDPSDDL